MCKREDAWGAVADLNDGAISAVLDPLDRIGQRFAIIAIGIGENGVDGYRTKIRIVELKDHAGPQNSHAPLPGHELRLIGVHATVDGFFDLLRDEGFSRRLDLFSERLRRRGLAPRQFGLFAAIEVSTRRPCVERRAVVDRGLALFLLQRRLKVRAGLEDKPLRRAYHPIGDRSSE